MPSLLFGLQQPRRFAGSEPPDPDAADIDALVDTAIRNGHIRGDQAALARSALTNLLRAADAGDATAEAAFLRQAEAYQTPSPLLGQPGFGRGSATGPSGVEGTGLPAGYQTFQYGGKTYITRQDLILHPLTGEPTGQSKTVIVDEISPTAAGGADQTLARLQAGLKAGTVTQEEYNAAVRNLTLTGSLRGLGGAGGITAYQQAQLGLSERRFNELELPQLALSQRQAAIAAARASSPLAYHQLITGATPEEALRAVPPAPFQGAIRRGEPISRPYVTTPSEGDLGAYRTPGFQAQARMTPSEAAIERERNTVAFGIPEQDQQYFEQRVRAGLFGSGGTRQFTFGGSI